MFVKHRIQKIIHDCVTTIHAFVVVLFSKKIKGVSNSYYSGFIIIFSHDNHLRFNL